MSLLQAHAAMATVCGWIDFSGWECRRRPWGWWVEEEAADTTGQLLSTSDTTRSSAEADTGPGASITAWKPAPSTALWGHSHCFGLCDVIPVHQLHFALNSSVTFFFFGMCVFQKFEIYKSSFLTLFKWCNVFATFFSHCRRLTWVKTVHFGDLTTQMSSLWRRGKSPEGLLCLFGNFGLG